MIDWFQAEKSVQVSSLCKKASPLTAYCKEPNKRARKIRKPEQSSTRAELNPGGAQPGRSSTRAVLNPAHKSYISYIHVYVVCLGVTALHTLDVLTGRVKYLLTKHAEVFRCHYEIHSHQNMSSHSIMQRATACLDGASQSLGKINTHYLC